MHAFIFKTWKFVFFNALFFYSLFHFLYSLGFHPVFASFLRTPFNSIHVQSGLVLLTGNTALLYLYRDDQMMISIIVLSVEALIAVIIIGHIIMTSVKIKQQQYRIFSPWKDVLVSLYHLLSFGSATGLKINTFLRLLEDQDQLVLTLEMLIHWMGGNRGVSAWSWLNVNESGWERRQGTRI